jgi:hypothetical protein
MDFISLENVELKFVHSIYGSPFTIAKGRSEISKNFYKASGEFFDQACYIALIGRQQPMPADLRFCSVLPHVLLLRRGKHKAKQS